MWAVNLLVFMSFWKIAPAAFPEVFCVFKQSCCILPCSFQSYGEVVVHWFNMASSELRVHSFYNNRDQLGEQDRPFRGRTSLFQDQISRGNASLLLRDVRFEDQGTFRCYTSTVRGQKDSFIRLSVEAPVSKVSIITEKNRIICSSEGIYPQPELTWSIVPPPNTVLENRTTVLQTEEQLYSISSSLMVPDDGSDPTYSCSVRTQRNRKRTTFRQQPSVTMTAGEAMIPCLALNSSLMNCEWRFERQIILNKTGSDVTVSERWRKHVKDVSEDGNLTLQDLTPGLEGSYRCEVCDGGELMVAQTFLQVPEGSSIVFPVAAAVVSISAVALLGFCCWMKKRSK